MTIQVTVADVHQMTPDVKQFRLVADDHRFDYRPGQHTHIHFQDEDGDEVERPYTAITGPRTHQICLTIKRYDDGTASVWMHDREPGDGSRSTPSTATSPSAIWAGRRLRGDGDGHHAYLPDVETLCSRGRGPRPPGLRRARPGAP